MGTTRQALAPPGSSFRGVLAADWGSGDVGDVIGVGMDANGLIVKGDGTSGILGVCCITAAMKAGDPIDVFGLGAEFADFKTLADDSTAVLKATKYYAASDGVVTATDTGTLIGHTLRDDGLGRLRLLTPVPPAA